MKIFLLLILAACLSGEYDARVLKPLRALEPSEEYTHTQIIDEDRPDQYQIFWKQIVNDEIQFEVHCKTTGWIGIGLSPNGGMPGSDIVIGWVKDGKAHLRDCHATGKITPELDQKQDYTLIEGAEDNGYTILKYKRKLATCDEINDKEIKIGTQYMIFAWNDNDPSTGNNDWIYHGELNRISKTLMLLSYKDESLDDQSSSLEDTFTHTIRMDNIKVPAKETYYYCDLFEIPKFEKPAHLIQFEILTNKDTKQHFHHILVFECDDSFVPDGPLARECGEVRLPQHVNRNCKQKIILGWGIGGQYNYTFPKKAGHLFEPSAKKKYFLTEMHYDNPSLKPEIIDNSGVKLYFTERLREHDLGVLLLGIEGGFLSLQIPPKSNNAIFTGICYPECTQRYIPDDGIYAVSALLHTHLAGRSVKTTLVRNDVAIRELFENPNYDFNYQFIMDIEPVKLQKGDALITKCRYDTNDRTNFTFAGFGTHEEMCYDFLYYYPRIPTFTGCMTLTNPKILFDFYQSLIKESLIPEIELNEEAFDDDEIITEFFQAQVKSNPQLVKRFEDFFGGSQNRTLYCGGSNGDSIYRENILDYIPKSNDIVEIDKCKNNNIGTNIMPSTSVIVIAAFFILF